MGFVDNALWMALAAAFVGIMIWWGRRSRDKNPNDRTSSNDGLFNGDGDGDGD